MRHDFDNFSIITEYSYLDVNDKDSETRKKELTPSISLDFSISELPVLIKAEYQYIEKAGPVGEDSHYEQLLQMEIEYKEISFSIIAEYSYKNWDDVCKRPLWLGGEIYTPIFENTELRFFIGKEKGGDVCRHGICQYQPTFKGFKLELTTTF